MTNNAPVIITVYPGIEMSSLTIGSEFVITVNRSNLAFSAFAIWVFVVLGSSAMDIPRSHNVPRFEKAPPSLPYISIRGSAGFHGYSRAPSESPAVHPPQIAFAFQIFQVTSDRLERNTEMLHELRRSDRFVLIQFLNNDLMPRSANNCSTPYLPKLLN